MQVPFSDLQSHGVQWKPATQGELNILLLHYFLFFNQAPEKVI